MTPWYYFLVSLIWIAREALAEYTRTVSYESEILVKCFNLTKHQINKLMTAEGIDIWNVDQHGNVDFRISIDYFAKIRNFFSSCTILENVERLVRRSERQMKLQTANSSDALHKVKVDMKPEEWFKEYHSYAEIVQWWKKLSEDNPEEVTFIESIGQSHEGRDMPAVVVTSSKDKPNTVYFQCLIHAREWISGTQCMYIMNYLMENKHRVQIANLLNRVRFVVVPIVNPDGYEYSWTTDRLWRKNRRSSSVCKRLQAISYIERWCNGVDLNRNFDYQWGKGEESSCLPCSIQYRGPHTVSEVETQNIVKFYKSLGNVVAALDWHSFGQMILRPYGWTMADCPDEARLQSLANVMSSIISSKTMRYYSSNKIGFATRGGVASDWFYSINGNINNSYRAASFTIELPDTGLNKFLLPQSQIIPTGKEWISPILWLVKLIDENPLPK